MQLSAIILDQWVPGDDACNLIAELKSRRPALPDRRRRGLVERRDGAIAELASIPRGVGQGEATIIEWVG